jgi:penicillin-binding protein 2
VIGGGVGDGRLSSANEAPSELRIGLVAILMALACIGFLVRLFQLQILEGADLASRSQRNSVRTERLEAPRGDIIDREGRVLATTRPAYTVQVVPNDVSAPGITYGVLGELLGRDGGELRRAVGEPIGRRRFQPVVLEADLGYEARARVETHRYALPGVVGEIKPRRHYVEGKRAAHLLGTIGEIDKHQLEWEVFDDYRQGEIIGKFGLESRLESHLRGKAGGRNVVVDVGGREIEVIDEVEPVPGGRVVLTLDLDLQRVAEEAFRASAPGEPDRIGALVAIDVRNGDVLALVSQPAFDPNLFAGGIDAESWLALRSDEWKPLNNRAISAAYPPGSTYKAIIAMAGLGEGLIDPAETVFCPGHYRLGRRVYRCWKRGGHGDVDLEQALVQSCDVYFYQLGVALGIDTIAKYAARFGLGKLTGVGLEGERPGLVPTRAWKQRARGEVWIKGETVSAAIGQGYDLVTPMQLAVAFAAIGSGQLQTPRLVERLETWDGQLVSEEPRAPARYVDVDPAHLEIVQNALREVVNQTGGTGWRARVPGVLVSGKTGTSQVVALDLVKDLEDDQVPVRFRDHAIFAAYAPAESPEIAVAVVAEHSGGGGGSVAAPMVQKVLARYFAKQRGENESIEGSPTPGELAPPAWPGEPLGEEPPAIPRETVAEPASPIVELALAPENED